MGRNREGEKKSDCLERWEKDVLSQTKEERKETKTLLTKKKEGASARRTSPQHTPKPQKKKKKKTPPPPHTKRGSMEGGSLWGWKRTGVLRGTHTSKEKKNGEEERPEDGGRKRIAGPAISMRYRRRRGYADQRDEKRRGRSSKKRSRAAKYGKARKDN